MNPQAYVSQALSLDGTPTGTSAIIGNYAGAPTIFQYTVPPNSVLHLARMLITLRDTGSIDWEGYGNAPAVTNGLIVRGKGPDGNTIIQSPPFRSNADWARVSFDARVLSDGSGDQFLVAAWAFYLAGSPLKFQPGSRIEVVANDDFSFLVDQRIAVNGELK